MNTIRRGLLAALLFACSLPAGAQALLTYTGGGDFGHINPGANGTCLLSNGVAWLPGICGSGSMVYPAVGIAISTGSAWNTSVAPGTGVLAALAINVGSAGAFITNGGALGTPSSGNAANLTGLPVSGLSGLGAGVGTFLGSGFPASANCVSTSSGSQPTSGCPAPNRTAASPTVAATDMGGTLNVSSGTITIPAISTTVFASGMTLLVVNYSTSTESISTTPTINSGGGCVSGTGIPAGDSWQITSNGTTLDCAQFSAGPLWLNTASSGTSVTPVCNPRTRLTVTTVTATGNLTINAPTGCTEGQQITLKITYTASDTYTWNAVFHANASNPGALPTASGGTSGVDFLTFYDDAANSRFDFLAQAPAF